MITVLLVLGLDYTRFGAQVRACVDNQRMARGLGLNVDACSPSPSRSAAALPASAARSAIEIVGLDPNFAFKYLVFMLIVVAVGGLASIRGAFVTAAMLGIIDIVSKYYVPQIGAFVLYLVMVGFLVWRPSRPVCETLGERRDRTGAGRCRSAANSCARRSNGAGWRRFSGSQSCCRSW